MLSVAAQRSAVLTKLSAVRELKLSNNDRHLAGYPTSPNSEAANDGVTNGTKEIGGFR